MSATKIALLRGINVGGHRKVPMAELRQLMTDLGFDQVKTYIQSGNIIFNTDGLSDVEKFKGIVDSANVGTEVMLLDWYPNGAE